MKMRMVIEYDLPDSHYGSSVNANSIKERERKIFCENPSEYFLFLDISEVQVEII